MQTEGERFQIMLCWEIERLEGCDVCEAEVDLKRIGRQGKWVDRDDLKKCKHLAGARFAPKQLSGYALGLGIIIEFIKMALHSWIQNTVCVAVTKTESSMHNGKPKDYVCEIVGCQPVLVCVWLIPKQYLTIFACCFVSFCLSWMFHGRRENKVL